MHSQYGEDDIVFEFFKGRKGRLLDIGANDGVTISNSLLFIENGWNAVLVEASPITFEKLLENHGKNKKVKCVNRCISDFNGKTTFYHNITHFGTDDKDLLSTIVEKNFEDSSRSYPFSTFEIECCDFDTLHSEIGKEKFDYISIDAEGVDFQILKQIDLSKLGTELLVIEYNDDSSVRENIVSYCSSHGLRNILHDNRINIILTT